MKTIYDFSVHGTPKAQPRPRMTKTGHVYTPDSAKAWKEAVWAKCLAHRKPIITQPVRLTVCFYFPIPASEQKREVPYPHTKKPDIDNLVKAVMDSMTNAGVWMDDTIVYALCAEKWFYQDIAGARIKVDVMEGTT